jgi:hypothetical protein
MALRLGEILVSRGLLTNEQVTLVLEAQRGRARPFGALAEEMFGLDAEDVEAAWLAQYEHAATRVDPRKSPPSEDVLASVSRRQAWQFRVLPLGRDAEGDLTLCTSAERLPRALRFAANCVLEPAVMVLAEPHALSEALAMHYPIAGFDTDELDDPLSVLGAG